MRKIAAAFALLALLFPAVSALAESLSAADLPSCCNTIYCPMRHRHMSDLQKDKTNCDAMASAGRMDCSMRACDAAPAPIVGTALFILVVPVALREPVVAGTAPALASRFFPYLVTIPLLPPPRTFLS